MGEMTMKETPVLLPMNHFIFVIFGIILVYAVSSGAAAAQTLEEQPRRPNILVIMADDLGWADVGFHGINGDVITPNIDKLAREGVILRNFYSYPMCMPARGAFLTGRKPWTFGLTREPRQPLPDTPLLSQALLQQGYNTSLIGKWDLGPQKPSKNKRFFGFQHAFHHVAAGYFKYKIWDSPRGSTRGYLTTHCGDEAVSFIEEQDPETPFFLWLAFLAPHIPWEAPAHYVDQFVHIQDPSRKMYLATIKAMDDEVAKVMQALQDTGRAGNTLTVFLSDNGGLWEHAVHNKPYRGGKLMPTEGGIRVPALVHWPGKLDAGGLFLPELMIEDLYPTLLAASSSDDSLPLNQTSPKVELDGRNFWPELFTETRRQTEFLEPLGNPIPFNRTRTTVNDISCYSAAVTSGNFKMLIENLDCNPTSPLPRNSSTTLYTSLPTSEKHQISLYDLSVDPAEQDNILENATARSREIKEVVRDLLALYSSAAKSWQATFSTERKAEDKKYISNLFCRDRIQQRKFHQTGQCPWLFTNVYKMVQSPNTDIRNSSFTKAVFDQDPAVFWMFQQGAKALHDFAPHGNHLDFGPHTLTPNPRLGFPGNTALASFSPKGGKSSKPVTFGLNFTIEVVFVLTDVPVNREAFDITDPNTSASLLKALLMSDGSVQIWSMQSMIITTPPNIIPALKLVHFVLAASRNLTMTLYVNSVVVGVRDYISSGGDAMIGFVSMGTRNFELLDEFVIYNKILNHTTVLDHSTALGIFYTPPPTPTAGQWRIRRRDEIKTKLVPDSLPIWVPGILCLVGTVWVFLRKFRKIQAIPFAFVF